MNLYGIEHKKDGKISIYSRYNDCRFKKFVNIDEEEISDLLKKV